MAIARVFFDIDMRLGIDGLNEVMKRASVRPASENDMMMFMNKRKTNMKIMWDNRYVLQLRKPVNEGQITIGDLQSIPGYFKNGFMSSSIETRILRGLEKQLKLKAA